MNTYKGHIVDVIGRQIFDGEVVVEASVYLKSVSVPSLQIVKTISCQALLTVTCILKAA